VRFISDVDEAFPKPTFELVGPPGADDRQLARMVKLCRKLAERSRDGAEGGAGQ
jgi:hypothetical protein